MKTLILPRVIGHRGACGYAPENTLASMRKAKSLGASWVEFDVQLTKDGVLIIFHDKHLERTSDGFGKICKKNYSDIATLDAGSWFNEKFSQEKIPTLHEMIACLNSLKLCANIELKPAWRQEKMLAKKIVELYDTAFATMEIPPLISSFSVKTLQYVREGSDAAMLGLLLSRWRRDYLEIAKQLNCSSIHLKYNLCTAKRMRLLKASGYALLAYTVNNVELANQLFAAGIDAVFSDYPDRFLR